MKPLEGKIKLNVDGSALGNPGSARFGGVLRKLKGAWLEGFEGAIGVATNLHAELMGLKEGLQMAWDWG